MPLPECQREMKRTKIVWIAMAAIALLGTGALLATGVSRAESPGSAFSESPYRVARRFIYPEQFKAGKAYSPGVLAGDTLYIGGQVSLDPQTGEQPEGFDAQAKLAMDNMGHVLRAAGMDFANVVTCHVYLADISSYKTMNAVYGSYFEAGSAPARTTLEMPALPGGSQIEVSCVAFADQSRIRIVEPPEGATPENKIPISAGVWAGDRLYLSGFGGRHPVSNKFDDTMEGQTQRAMENVAGTLKAAGLGFENVVFANPYFLTRESYPKLNSVWKTFFELGTAPSRASFCISRLPGPLSRVQFALVATKRMETKGRVIPHYMGTSPTSSGGGVLDGDTLWTSGKSGDGKTLEEQMRSSLEKIRDTLRLAGMDLENVVQAHVYLKDAGSDMGRMDQVFREYFPNNAPARTTVQVIHNQFDQVAVVAVR